MADDLRQHRAGHKRVPIEGHWAPALETDRCRPVPGCGALLLAKSVYGARGFDICAGPFLLRSGSFRVDRLCLYRQRTKTVLGVAQRSHLDYSWRDDLETLAIQFPMGARTTRRNWTAGDRYNAFDHGSCNAQAHRRSTQHAPPRSASCVIMNRQKRT